MPFFVYLRMKKILVTGSNGLLGQKLTDKLCSDNRFELIASSKGENRNILKGEYYYEDLDITDEDRISEVFEKHKPDIIIHTAAITNVDTCHQETELCREVNVDAVESLVEAANRFNCHFIHLSTDFIFDGENGPYTETDLPNPLSIYGQSKLDAEQLVMGTAKRWAILRTVLVYGAAKNMSRSNIVLWAKDSLSKGQPINVVNDQFRTPTLADDLADACILVAMAEVNGIYHISGEDMMSIADIVYAVARHWNLETSTINPVSSDTLNQEAKRPKRTGFIIDKAKTNLGYKPHSFAMGLEILSVQLSE